jgi:hypothetical protein
MEAMLNSRRDHHDWKALARDLGTFLFLYPIHLLFNDYGRHFFSSFLNSVMTLLLLLLYPTGYTSTRIASFEQRAIEKQTGPTRHLFGDWAKREDSTVENLVSSLCNIGRHDVTLLLMPPFNQQETHQQIHQSRPHTTSSLPRTTATTTRCYKPISVV